MTSKIDGTPKVVSVDSKDVERVSESAESSGKSSVDGKRWLQGRDLFVVYFCLIFGLILSVMDSSVVATALVDIGQYFDDFITLQWVVLAYFLTYTGFALIFARLSDVLGRKRTTIVALIILTTMSLGCGLARTLEQLIAFRALQGLGGSGVYSMAMTTLPDVTPVRKFAMLSAFIGVAFTLSAVLGPVVGGIITTHSSWRWCFLFNVPCGALIIFVALVGWPNEKETVGRISWRQLDLLGCVLYLAATVLLIFALQEAGSEVYAWNSPTVIACLVVAGLATIAFALWIWLLSSRKGAVAPLVHSRVFLNRVLVLNIAVSILVGYVFYTVLIELPERFQILNGKSAQTAGISLLPLSGASALGSGISGLVSSKRNNSYMTLVASCSLMVLGAGLLSSVKLSRDVPDSLYGFEAILGLGIGGALASTTIVSKINAEPEDSASAQGLLGQSRILGGNIGLAIATVVLNQNFSSDLQGTLSPQQIADLKQSLKATETFTPQQIEAVGLSVAASFRRQVQVCVAIAGLAVILAAVSWQRHPPQFGQGEKAEEVKEEEST